MFARTSRPASINGSVLQSALLTLALTIGTTSLSAQSSEDSAESEVAPLVTDRPTDSASPTLVPRHMFQVELGYKFSRLERESDQIDTQNFPDLLMRFGINKKIEVRLSGAGWTVQDDAMEEQEGFSDHNLGVKIALANERGHRPQMSLLVDVGLPVGHNDFTNHYLIPKVLFLAANGLTDRIAVTYNIGPSFITSESSGEKQTNVDLNYAVALSGAANGSVSIFGEFYGALVSGSNSPDRHNFQAGTTVLLSKRFQIDIRGGVGLVDNEPDWLVGAGLAFRLPR